MAHHGLNAEEINGLLDHLEERARHGDPHVLHAMENADDLENMILQQYVGIPPLLAHVVARQFHANVQQMRAEARREERRQRKLAKDKARGDSARGGMDAEEGSASSSSSGIPDFLRRRKRDRDEDDEEEEKKRERDRKSLRKSLSTVASSARSDRQKMIEAAMGFLTYFETVKLLPITLSRRLVAQMYGDDILNEALIRRGERHRD